MTSAGSCPSPGLAPDFSSTVDRAAVARHPTLAPWVNQERCPSLRPLDVHLPTCMLICSQICRAQGEFCLRGCAAPTWGHVIMAIQA